MECDIPVVLDSEIGLLCVELFLAGAQKSVFFCFFLSTTKFTKITFFSSSFPWKETYYFIQRMRNEPRIGQNVACFKLTSVCFISFMGL